MACVGEGGKTSDSGLRAGDGGGIGIAGGNAQDLWFGGGKGGPLVGTANLTLNGKYGSAYPAGTGAGALGVAAGILYPGDENVASGKGGVSIRCTKGIYWRNQGLSACSDIEGNTQFRLSNGAIVTNTGSIERGYKAGYNIIQTAGRFNNGTFRGGNGATGGDGGVGERPGGGGSGYSDGSFTIVSTTQGGSTSDAKVVIRVVT